MAETMIECSCENCGLKFSRRLAEINRNKKVGRKIVCSLKCSGKINYGNIPVELRTHKENLVPNNRRDEYTPFRIILQSAKRRAKKKKCEITITLQDLLNQWNKQNGICPYTRLLMIQSNSRNPYQVSIDRIDSSKGYTIDNIELVSLIAQYAKNCFSKQDVIEFCAKVSANHT